MKKPLILLFVLLTASFAKVKAQSYDIESIPDKDLFGNYIIIRFTPLMSTRAEAVNEMNKFKAWCDENTYVKHLAAYTGVFQVKSIEKDKSTKWFGGYCNYKRQRKELYEMDKKFIQMYCENAEIVQFKEVIKNDNFPAEK